MENPYGIAAMWAQSDIVIKAVAFSLLFMSIATWCVILIKGIKLYKLKQHLLALSSFGTHKMCSQVFYCSKLQRAKRRPLVHWSTKHACQGAS